MNPENVKRNIEIYVRHKNGESYRHLGAIYGLKAPTVVNICKRVQNGKVGRKYKDVLVVVHR